MWNRFNCLGRSLGIEGMPGPTRFSVIIKQPSQVTWNFIYDILKYSILTLWRGLMRVDITHYYEVALAIHNLSSVVNYLTYVIRLVLA